MRDFVVYVLQGCHYSEAAVALLERKGEKIHRIVIPRDQKERIKEQNGMQTFPQIFMRRKGIGKSKENI